MRRSVVVGKDFDLTVAVLEDEPPAVKSKQPRVARRVVVGTQFDVDVKVKDEGPEARDAITRARIVYVVLAMSTVFLSGAAAQGLYKGDFGNLQHVWSIVGPVYGGIAAYFFAKGGRRAR